ncbi:integrase arm-type DNA-binding domain-containing protein [Neisseria lisongii]|uniref:Integrase arm-type DNA-binding domain-containing protein n=1 Tax=Neisseria lisongii TaxID=2912188 RepID=A0ABY7RIX8_9NEIS|nr:site-specific integrase [Neisseria lisongii]WCL71584.1 integrase arm-type DNA-binding domain-containing protein [Neisseria lisongii]
MFTVKQINNLKLPPEKNKMRFTDLDENGLSVVVRKTAKGIGKYFVLRYTHAGKQRELNLGSYPKLSLAQARAVRDEALSDIAKGLDPAGMKQQQKQQAREAAANTFCAVAEKWFATWQHGKAEKTRRNHQSRLKNHLYPLFEHTPIAEMKRSDIVRLAESLNEKGISGEAAKIMQTASMVFDYAASAGLVELNLMRAVNTSVLLIQHETEHQPTIRPSETVAFFKAFIQCGGEPVTRYALLLLVLTAMRNEALRLAKWSDIDLTGRVWLFPAENMKMKNAVKIPLSDWAVALLKELHTHSGHTPYLFPQSKRGGGQGTVISGAAIGRLLSAMGYDGKHEGKSKAVPHGFRSFMKGLCMEQGYSAELTEQALAHQPKGVDKAYMRSDLFERRAEMMAFYSGWLYERYRQAERELAEEQIARLQAKL